jgi:hypothetical protein
MQKMQAIMGFGLNKLKCEPIESERELSQLAALPTGPHAAD